MRSLAVVLAATLLSGCWGIRPVEKSGLVAVLGLDPAPGGYQVSLLVSRPSGTSNAGVGAPATGQPATVEEATAPTLVQAIEAMRARSRLELSFTHLAVVVVSASVARSGLAAPLAMLATTRHMVETPWLVVARATSAMRILQALTSKRPRPGGVAYNVVTEARVATPYQAAHLFTLLNEMNLKGDQFATAGAGLLATPGGTRLEMRGVAMFRADRLVGWLDGEAAWGWLLATGRAGRPTLTVATPDGPVGFRILQDSRTIRIARGPTGPAAVIGIRVSARLVSLPPGPADFWRHPGQEAVLRSAAAKTIAGDVAAALQAARAAGADVFSLGEYVRLSDPARWRSRAATWNTSGFPGLPVRVSVRVALRSLGQTVCPILGAC